MSKFLGAAGRPAQIPRRPTSRSLSRVSSAAGRMRRVAGGRDLGRAEKRKANHLLAAILADSTAKVRTLLAEGAPVDACDALGTPLHYACRRGNVEVVTALCERGALLNVLADTNMSPLHLAALGGHVHTVLVLCQRGARVDVCSKFEKRTALHLACLNGHAEVGAVLIGYHAAVDACDIYGTTPLHLAVRMGHLSTVQLLLEHGANPGLQDKEGWTALHLAAEAGLAEVMSKLMEPVGLGKPSTCAVNAQNKYGRTALHWACMHGHVHVTRILLQQGADTSIPDRAGRTPADLAANPNIRQIIKFYSKPYEEGQKGMGFQNVHFELQPPKVSRGASLHNKRLSFYNKTPGGEEVDQGSVEYDDEDSDSGVDGEEVGELSTEELHNMDVKLRKVLRTTSRLTDTLDEDVHVMSLELSRALRSEHLSTTNEIVKDVYRKLQWMEQKLADFRLEIIPDSRFLRQRFPAVVELAVKTHHQHPVEGSTEKHNVCTDREEARMIHFLSSNLSETPGKWKDIIRHMWKAASSLDGDVEVEIKRIEQKFTKESDRAFEALWVSLQRKQADGDDSNSDDVDGFKDVLKSEFDLRSGITDDESSSLSDVTGPMFTLWEETEPSEADA